MGGVTIVALALSPIELYTLHLTFENPLGCAPLPTQPPSLPSPRTHAVAAMGASSSQPVVPKHDFPWEQTQRFAGCGMSTAKKLIAQRVEVGMGACDAVVCRRLNVGMGKVGDAGGRGGGGGDGRGWGDGSPALHVQLA